MGIVYLLHFSRPHHHARHYMGWTENLPARLKRHRAGNGARLIEVIIQNGNSFDLARIWTNADRAQERRLKNGHNSPLLCPICKTKKDPSQ
jgi:predicted GIY-YIG superfamily endonuclease